MSPRPGRSRPSRSTTASPTAWAPAAAASARAWRSSWSTTARSRSCSRRRGSRPHLGHNALLVPPEDRFVCRFAAEPPQELLPYGRWAERLREEFLAACLRIEDEVGEPGEIVWYPDRTWGGRTYVPATVRTDAQLELYGVVSFAPAVEDGQEPDHFVATADWTEETVEANPDWTIDVCEEGVGGGGGGGGGGPPGTSCRGHR